MSNRKLVITDCTDCPLFLAIGRCYATGSSLSGSGFLYPIPDTCPLEETEETATVPEVIAQKTATEE